VVEEVADHPVTEAGVRAGYAVNGLLHLLIAWLGLQVAFGRSGTEADPSGAMAVVAASPVGMVVLIAVVVAFALLAIWQLGEAVRGPETGDRVKAIAKALTYLALAWLAVSILMGSGGSGRQQAKDTTAALMDLPFGGALVVVLGLVVVGVGAYHIYKGWTEKFRSDLTSTPPALVVNAGKVGYIAKGIALIAVGAGLVVAGVRNRPSESRGLDGALHDIAQLPMGQALLTLIALGFAAYGFYSFSRAQRART
jgi:uncharacterized membrane protein